MSRPGYVFDLSTEESPAQYECRSCGRTERGDAKDRARLHARMMAHLVEQHGLQNAASWKVTHQDRGEGVAAICFWPPEAV
jgi:hypothetical protein